MHDFVLDYHNDTVIAIAPSDERAAQLLEHYESIVSSNGQINLNDLVIDDLHLYAPQFHQSNEECNEGVNQFLTQKDST